MTAKADLRHAQHLVHQAETLAKHRLDPDTFSMIAQDFDRLIRTLDELAQVELTLDETNDD